jgi:hypothetical protein
MACFELTYEFPIGSKNLVRRHVEAADEVRAKDLAGVQNPTLRATEILPVLAPKTHKARRNLAELRGEVPHYAGEVRTGWTYADHDPMRVRFLIDYFLGAGEGRLYISSSDPVGLAAELGIDASGISMAAKGHAHKFDSVVKDSNALVGLDEELGMFFNTNGYRCVCG